MKYYAEAMKTKEDHLEYSGVKGMHWGIRRFQNKDGSLTELGKKRAAEGQAGISKVLKKGQADARNTRMGGAVKGMAAYTTSTFGGTAAGAAIGSSAGPAGTIAGAAVGGLTGAIAGRGAYAIIRLHANEKAAALSQEYQLLGQKMMESYGKTKVKDIDYASSSIVDAGPAAEAVADAYHKKGIYTSEYTDEKGKRHIDPIKNEQIAFATLKDEAYKEQTKAINALKKSK